MPLVDVPDLGQVEFPDGLSNEQMAASIKKTLAARQPKSIDLTHLPKSTEAPIGLEAARKEFPGLDVREPHSDEGLITSLPKAVVGDTAAGLAGLSNLLHYPVPKKPGYGALFPNASEMSGNIPAAIMGKPLPIEQTITDISKDKSNVPEAALAKVSLGIAKTAPFAAVGVLPATAQKLIAAGFALDMARHVPGTFRELGAEMGKPENEQDPDKISSLIAEGAQEIGFSGLAGAHGAREGMDFSKQLVDRYVPRGQGITGTKPLAPIGEFAGAKPLERAVVPPKTPVEPSASPKQPQTPPIAPQSNVAHGVSHQGAKLAPVTFLGIQEAPAPMKPMELYNLTEAIPGHPKGSTMGRAQLEKMGYVIPEAEANKAVQPSTERPSPSPVASLSGTVSSAAPKVPTKEAAIVETTVKKPDTQGQLVGMGGATPSEFAPSEPSARETYGIAQRVRERAARQGEGLETPPGQGIAAPDSVERGRELLTKGADPETILSNFEKTKRLSSDDMAVVRAQGEKLRRQQIATEREFGTDSDEYRHETAIYDAWQKRTKPMQTEWSKTGQAQQGETDIDTGTFTGLRNAFHEVSGKEFTPRQADAAKKIATRVSTADESAQTAKAKVLEEVTKKATPEDDPQVAAAKRALAVAQEVFQRQQAKVEAIEKEAQPVKVGEDAEQGAIDAANQTVRESAARLAKAETDKRIASTVRDRAIAEEQIKAERKALQAAQKTVREATARKAKAERSKGTAEQQRNLAIKKMLAERERKALTAAQKAVRDNAKRLADLENKRRVQQADIKNLLWKLAKESIEGGEDDFDNLRQNLATETGLPVNKVNELLAQDRAFKRLSDEMYRNMADLRKLKETAKNWVKDQNTPGWLRMVKSVPRAFFVAKVFGHGTVGMITHAGLNMFNPEAWRTYWPEFFRQYKLAFGKSYHEQAMQDLVRDPNYITARRAGLANDPWRYADDYQSATMKSAVGKLGGLVGNRGFDALKLFRQARFNQVWNDLPLKMKTPEAAEVLSDAINHATGTVRMPFREWTNWTFFAPKLEGSRWAWMFGDPVRASRTFVDWRNATPDERMFAIAQLKEKAMIAGTYFTLLAINQGLLKASNSKESVNFTNPKRGDFLSFKAAGHNIGIVGPMLGMVRLFAELYHDSRGQRSRFESLDSRAKESAGDVWQYARGKLSPFAGNEEDIRTQSDYSGRPLPFSSDRVPSYLLRQGQHKYTWPEWATEKLAPIPAEEAIKEVWTAQGMKESEQKAYLKALLTGILAGSTGARVTTDTRQEQATGNR